MYRRDPTGFPPHRLPFGVSAYLAGIDEVKGAPRLEPLIKQVTDDPFAQLDFGHLVGAGPASIAEPKARPQSRQNHELVKEFS